MKPSVFIVVLISLSALFASASFADEVTLEFPNMTYTGKVTDGVPNWYGTAVYKGQWKGMKYVGEWESGQYKKGTLTGPNGDQYAGEWKDNNPNGHGTYLFADGRKYVGQSKGGKYHGIGALTTADGAVYSGEWKEGDRVVGIRKTKPED